MPEFLTASEFAPVAPAAMLEEDTERAALLREIEGMTTEEIKAMLNQYRRACSADKK